ncbi:MAG: RNA polymerase subunit sigma-24, partial [Duncaniella sp.]|nr:RNA polymerase subunit sigma-24 [Duncaniella sp.]
LVWLELDSALADLPQEQSEVFCMTVFDGIPVKDISNATGIPVATLLSRKHYAVKFLRTRFHELYDALISQS